MRELLRIVVFVAALSVAAIGAMLGFAGLALGLFSSGPNTLTLVTLGASLSVMSLALGSASAWHAWRAIQELPSAPFRPQRIWPLVVLFLLALALGQMMLSLSLLPALTFPLLHVTAAALPALIIIALIGRALGGVTTWRDLVLQTASGAFLATPLAFILEMIAILLIASAAFLGLARQPGGPELILRVTAELQDPTWQQDPGALGPALLTPAVMAAMFTLAAGLIPLIEEAVKTIGLGIAAYRRPSLHEALLWGTSAGAGFAIAEGLLNATVALGTWLPVVLLRVGTTLLHCTTGALMGLAWYHVLARRSWFRGLALYLVSTTIHGLWNGFALAMALPSLKAMGADPTSGDLMTSGLGMLTFLSLLGVLALGMAAGLAGLIIHTRRQSQAIVLRSEQAFPVPGKSASSEEGLKE